MVGEGTQRAAMMRESALTQGKKGRSYERRSRSTKTFTKTTGARRGVREDAKTRARGWGIPRTVLQRAEPVKEKDVRINAAMRNAL